MHRECALVLTLSGVEKSHRVKVSRNLPTFSENFVFSFFFWAEIKCPDLTDPANGDLTMNSISVGATANFSCNSGYFLVGEAVLTCGGDGTWSAEPPQCIGKYIEPGDLLKLSAMQYLQHTQKTVRLYQTRLMGR